ncbi:Uncharacterized protein Nst1_131 [Candidatus Nanobsidianus stetteri]|uniref:Uncharacterized protein n=1 Tax=Nanobsidianus stetteri TaxID=1294122 RepID=R1E5W8_NANST|nr:Uncharacterized protein Nst1_131 [Candidatus Nanobsidianus stetteri]
MRSDFLTTLVIIFGIILGITVILYLFVPPQVILKLLGKNTQSSNSVSFKISYMYYTSNSIYAIIYNGGPDIDLSNMQITYTYSQNSYQTGTCNIVVNNYTLPSNSQEIIELNCTNEDLIINNLMLNKGSYEFSFKYGNTIQQAPLPFKISNQ